MAKTRQCIFCGNEYEYCPHCSNSNKYPNWMFNFDTEKCHDLYEVVAGYNMGIKTIEDVKSALDKYEVTDYTIFSKKLQDKLKELVPQKKEEKSETEKKPEISKKDNNFKPRDMKKNNNKFNFERRANTEE